MGQTAGFDSAAILVGPSTEVSGQFSFTEGASVDRKGNVFFTDQPNNKIWEYTVYGQLVLFMDSTGRSNGMYFDRRGRLITCADEKGQLWAIDGEGKLSGKRLFCLKGSDGMTLDAQGNVYLTGNGVTVYNIKGTRVAYIPVPQKWTGNLCFGGEDRKTLFITASTGVYTVPMRVKGVE